MYPVYDVPRATLAAKKKKRKSMILIEFLTEKKNELQSGNTSDLNFLVNMWH